MDPSDTFLDNFYQLQSLQCLEHQKLAEVKVRYFLNSMMGSLTVVLKPPKIALVAHFLVYSY
jgi:hypothetical protein